MFFSFLVVVFLWIKNMEKLWFNYICFRSSFCIKNCQWF